MCRRCRRHHGIFQPVGIGLVARQRFAIDGRPRRDSHRIDRTWNRRPQSIAQHRAEHYRPVLDERDLIRDRNVNDDRNINDRDRNINDVERLLKQTRILGHPMRTRTIGLIIVAIAIAGGGAFAVMRKPALPPAAAAPPPVPVVAGKVTSQDVPIYLRGIGTVIAYNTDIVRSQIQGQLTRIAFTEGQTVRTGDMLAQIDPRPYQAQLDQMTATRDRDQAQLNNALGNLSRYTQLEGKGYATPQLLETQQAQVGQLQNAVKSDQAMIEQAQIQLGYTQLTSPISGITGVRQIDVGNIIHPTDPNGLVVVTQIEPISLIFTLPETYLPQIQQEMANNKQPLTVLAFSQDDKIQLDQGKVDLINNQILQTTGAVQLKAEFPNSGHRLWPGELVNARLLLQTRHNGLTVPAGVVQQSQQGMYAYVIKPDNTVEQRNVTVAQISDGEALIDSGLAANEQVVVDGQSKLQPGSKVTILHGKAAEEAAAQSAQQIQIP
jgi:multidrug efflux system membrane fusion protein